MTEFYNCPYTVGSEVWEKECPERVLEYFRQIGPHRLYGAGEAVGIRLPIDANGTVQRRLFEPAAFSNPVQRIYRLHTWIIAHFESGGWEVEKMIEMFGEGAASPFDRYRMWHHDPRPPNWHEARYELTVANITTILAHWVYGMDQGNALALIDEYTAPKGPDGSPRTRLWGPCEYPGISRAEGWAA